MLIVIPAFIAVACVLAVVASIVAVSIRYHRTKPSRHAVAVARSAVLDRAAQTHRASK